MAAKPHIVQQRHQRECVSGHGVNATDPRGGSWGSLVNVNFDAVQEVRVIALGSKAEYGSATGVAVDVLTKVRKQRVSRRSQFLQSARQSRQQRPLNSARASDRIGFI